MVLLDFSLSIELGGTVAKIGGTDSEKRTILNLACRSYEPTAGRILIDGVDNRELPLSLLHGHLGIDLRQPYLFSGSVRDNIRQGKPGASEGEIEATASARP